MQIACPACAKMLDFSGERPRFCAFCGQSLTASTPRPVDVDETAALATVAATIGRSDPAASTVPDTIGGYRVLRRIGGGAMGAVYEAEEMASGRRVALKLVLPEYAGSATALVRFRQEGRLASTLAHPRCVFVLAADEEAGRPYIVMELMPGSTLDDLVRERGPLPPEEAIAKILDVIDGLDEAHRLGLIHRDVKPSNCFLEANGRVKVGDFGLVRSLQADAKLTSTGAFVGTPLYAAPEQIHKNDPTDAQSDVYSVAATLYFLLTGQAPFQSVGDPMATLARKVTENPPPLRSIRPGLPKSLDKVVMRGLERDRRRRWKDVDELRRALVPFLPGRPSVGGLGLRFGAYLLDTLVVSFAGIAAGFVIRFAGGYTNPVTPIVLGVLCGIAINLGYFGLLEGLLGWSLAKRLLRLRVGTVAGVQPPGVGRAVLRIAILYLIINLGNFVSQIAIAMNHDVPRVTFSRTTEQHLVLSIVVMSSGIWQVVAVLLILLPMRARNGYRGLHEVLSGTRTYHLRWPTPRARHARRQQAFAVQFTHPDGLPERVGPFQVRGALAWTDSARTLLAEDPRLGRTVALWLRPASDPPLSATERGIDRATRVRWLTGGTDGGWQWDAFLAPAGMPLPVLASNTPRLGWAEVRVILEDLADELAASGADGTLPPVLTAEQVWVQPDGRVQLLPMPAGGDDMAAAASGQDGALRLLREVAILALEGVARPVAEGSIRAPVPVYAEHVLGRLLKTRRPLESAEQLRQELEVVRERPAEVNRTRRAWHLALMALFLHLPLAGPVLLFAASFGELRDIWRSYSWNVFHDPSSTIAYATIGIVTGFWVGWAFLCRGGYLFWRGGIVLRRADGRKPSRLQCGLRALLIWGPIAALYCAVIAVARAIPQLPEVYFAIWGATTLLLPLYAALAVMFPRRSLHDWIAGTYLMPE